jgi:hypothetical protein
LRNVGDNVSLTLLVHSVKDRKKYCLLKCIHSELENTLQYINYNLQSTFISPRYHKHAQASTAAGNFELVNIKLNAGAGKHRAHGEGAKGCAAEAMTSWGFQGGAGQSKQT